MAVAPSHGRRRPQHRCHAERLIARIKARQLAEGASGGGGAGSFVIVAEDYNSFGRAMVRKLIAEIATRPEAETATPGTHNLPRPRFRRVHDDGAPLELS
jgi:Protein of unknown function (DUF1194)